MKKAIITLILLGFIIQANSQYNTQLIDPSKTWSIADQQCEGCGGILYSFYIKLQGDTTINAINYTKIYQALDEFMTEWEPYGFIREEENRYYLRNLPGEEGLAYDFSVNIGDTVEINNPFGAMPVATIVTDIDSVFIEPGNELRKRISLYEYQYFFNEEYWIEGIGSSAGLTVSGMDMTLLTGGDDYTLLCYYEEDEMLFKSTLYPLCFYPLVDIPEIDPGEGDVILFPNPASDQINMKFSLNDPSFVQLRILALDGKVINTIYSGELTKGMNEISWNLRDKVNEQMPVGTYFVQLISNNSSVVRKIVVLSK